MASKDVLQIERNIHIFKDIMKLLFVVHCEYSTTIMQNGHKV